MKILHIFLILLVNCSYFHYIKTSSNSPSQCKNPARVSKLFSKPNCNFCLGSLAQSTLPRGDPKMTETHRRKAESMGTKISHKQILLCPLGSHHPGAVHSTLQSAGAVHNVQCTVLVQH